MKFWKQLRPAEKKFWKIYLSVFILLTILSLYAEQRGFKILTYAALGVYWLTFSVALVIYLTLRKDKFN